RQTRKDVEQNRRRRDPADETRDRGPVWTAHPDADGTRAVNPDRPGIAIAVTGTGLEGDMTAGGVFRGWRAQKHLADITGGDGIEQPLGQQLARPLVSGERPGRALPGDSRIEHS